MRGGAGRAALLALASATLAATAAAASPPDCRRIPVYSARCYGLAEPHPGCRPIPAAAAPCFTVRGELFGANGNPTFRLHPSGSRRLLGVLGGDGDAASPSVLPPNVRAAMTPAAPGDLAPVSGVFRVCPLASDRAGWMRPVCIDAATALAPASDAR